MSDSIVSDSPFEALVANAESEAAKKIRGTPNYTQYQLAIAEMSEKLKNDPPGWHVADAYAQLRHLMERQFNLPTLDDFVAKK